MASQLNDSYSKDDSFFKGLQPLSPEPVKLRNSNLRDNSFTNSKEHSFSNSGIIISEESWLGPSNKIHQKSRDRLNVEKVNNFPKNNEIKIKDSIKHKKTHQEFSKQDTQKHLNQANHQKISFPLEEKGLEYHSNSFGNHQKLAAPPAIKIAETRFKKILNQNPPSENVKVNSGNPVPESRNPRRLEGGLKTWIARRLKQNPYASDTIIISELN